MKSASVDVKTGNVRDQARDFLRLFLDKDIVNALLVPRALPAGEGFVQSLIADPAMLDAADPFAPTVAVQSARILSDVTSAGQPVRLAAVVKPCEMRAVVELAKFLQVNLDNVITIGVDCLGTCEVKRYAAMSPGEREALSASLVDGGGRATGGPEIRDACRICEHPAPAGADLTIGFVNGDQSKGMSIILGERRERELEGKLGLAFTDGEPPARQKAIETIVRGRTDARARAMSDIAGRIKGIDKLLETFSTCIRCRNCMNVCPICYCKQCVFNSPVFEHGPERYAGWARRKGVIRMPVDTLMFHLTRLSHMATSCVSCGLCDSACPNGLPVSALFSLAGGQVRDLFDYVPGRSVSEEPPVSVFKEDELKAESGTD